MQSCNIDGNNEKIKREVSHVIYGLLYEARPCCLKAISTFKDLITYVAPVRS